MFFLWSTATSSSSELVWPHVFQEGMRRCGGEGPRGAHTAKHQNNMSHSCLMTSTTQPCRALTVHFHPEGSCNMKVIYLFHTTKYSQFVITLFPYRSMTQLATNKGCLEHLWSFQLFFFMWKTFCIIFLQHFNKYFSVLVVASLGLQATLQLQQTGAGIHPYIYSFVFIQVWILQLSNNGFTILT